MRLGRRGGDVVSSSQGLLNRVPVRVRGEGEGIIVYVGSVAVPI